MIFFGKKRASINKVEGRKNRGQPTQKVISYYTASRRQLDNFERNAIYNQNKASSKKYLHFLSRSWFSLLISSVLMIAIGYLCLLGEDPRVVISGPVYRPTSHYQTVSKHALKSDFKNRFKFLLKSEKVETNLLKILPEAESIEVKSSFLGHRPEIKIFNSAYLAYFFQGEGNYILSARGRLLLLASESTIDLKDLPIIQNKTGVDGKEGEQFISPDEASALLRLVGQYKADGTLPGLTLTTVPHELNAREPGRGYYAKFILNEDITSQYGSLRATEKRLQETGQGAAEYIDVRLSNKVYFK